MADKDSRVNQCQNPTGWLGRWVLRNMNSRHSQVTDWGLSQASIGKGDIILDVGCGGGRTVSKLAAVATQGKVYGQLRNHPTVDLGNSPFVNPNTPPLLTSPETIQ